MNAPHQPDPNLEQRVFRKLLDVFIRAGLTFALAALCYRIFSPFISLMVWALILAVTLYPAHQKLAHRLGERQGLAATLLVLGGILVIGLPTAVLMSSVGESAQDFIGSVRGNTLAVPAPSPAVAGWPIVGERIHELWSQAHADLPAFVRSMQPQLGDLARTALGVVASMASGALLFLASERGEPSASDRFSLASWASGGAPNSRNCPPRRFVRWHWVYLGWPSSRPSSLAW
jgi:predicted PurR-regulated permease PerM